MARASALNILPGLLPPSQVEGQPTCLSSQAEVLSQPLREGLPLFTTGSGYSLSRGRLLPPGLIPLLLGSLGGSFRT